MKFVRTFLSIITLSPARQSDYVSSLTSAALFLHCFRAQRNFIKIRDHTGNHESIQESGRTGYYRIRHHAGIGSHDLRVHPAVSNPDPCPDNGYYAVSGCDNPDNGRRKENVHFHGSG